MEEKYLNGAQLLVKCLEKNNVKFVFGIPGAKIDAVFNALLDSSIRTILCRHEQNAAFMAAAHGRLTGEPGVVVVTSGPGVTNLTTGLLTATTEGDPVVAIGGCVPRNMLLKSTHQNADNVLIMSGVTKKSVIISDVNNIPEAVENCFRTACTPKRGACFISVPQDVLSCETKEIPLEKSRKIQAAAAPEKEIKYAAEIINKAKYPVIFIGEEASDPKNTNALRNLLKKHKLPVIATFQGAGAATKELEYLFVGRVGLFRNHPGDKLLDMADVVITVGFNEIEYDPEAWNSKRDKKIVHIDYTGAQVHSCYQTSVELIGDIEENLNRLSGFLKLSPNPSYKNTVKKLHEEAMGLTDFAPSFYKKNKIHPVQFIRDFRALVKEDDIITCDIGTIYMWMAKCFYSYRPRHVLYSNGQQTLGVALPWAMSAKLAFPSKRVFSLSGDGGFLFSSMELETAVREKIPFIHFVWSDGSYDMVLEQELIKYQRPSAVFFGHVDIVSYAKAFGAKGYKMNSIDDFKPIVKEALNNKVPSIIDVPIDYSQNKELFVTANSGQIH